MRVTLGTDVADPSERLAAVISSSREGKRTAERLGGSFFADALGFYPYLLRRAAMRGFTEMATRREMPLQLANTIVTNIPNPPGGHYIAGSRVLSYAGFGPLAQGFGLFHTVTGMEWGLSVSVTSCREIMPDIADYIADLRASFEELREAALGGGTPPDPAAAVERAAPAESPGGAGGAVTPERRPRPTRNRRPPASWPDIPPEVDDRGTTDT